MSKKIETLICECHSVEHIVLFSFDTNWDEVFMSFHLRKVGFWKRLIYGIKYIFGHQCNYGAFDEVILKAEDYQKIQNIADRLRELNKRHSKESDLNL